MRRFLVVIFGILVLSVLSTGLLPIEACGGGPPPGFSEIDNLLSGWNIVVVGRVRTVSESGINAVLDIDYFLKGNGEDELLLLSRLHPEEITVALDDHASPYQCAEFPSVLSAGQKLIAGLDHYEDGSYSGTVIAEDPNGMFTMNATSQPDQYVSLSYPNMIAHVSARLNDVPHPPHQHVLPRPVVIRVRTDVGESYWLPVDQISLSPIPAAYSDRAYSACLPLIPVPCTQHLVAPNGLYVADFYPSGTGVVDYVGLPTRILSVEGETGVFSPSSELLTVWSGQALQIYATFDQLGLGTLMSLRSNPVGRYINNPEDPLIAGAGAWSPNGRSFAFSTQSGIWLWDALSPHAQPVRLLSASDNPIRVVRYSPMGNYLNVEEGDHRYNVDVQSHHLYPDGLFSPDDRLLAAYDTTAARLTPLQIYQLLPNFAPSLGWNDFTESITQFEWTNRAGYIYAACGDPIPDADSPGFDQPWCKIRNAEPSLPYGAWVDGIAFDYDPVTHSLSTLVNGHTMTLNGEIFDFTGQIDGDITHIELVPLIDLDAQRL